MSDDKTPLFQPYVASNLPLVQAGTVVASTAIVWTKLIALEVQPDEQVYIDSLWCFMHDTGDGRKIKITSNDETLLEYEPVEGYFYIMWWGKLTFKGKQDRHPLTVWFKTDGTHSLTAESQIGGIRTKLKEEGT